MSKQTPDSKNIVIQTNERVGQSRASCTVLAAFGSSCVSKKPSKIDISRKTISERSNPRCALTLEVSGRYNLRIFNDVSKCWWYQIKIPKVKISIENYLQHRKIFEKIRKYCSLKINENLHFQMSAFLVKKFSPKIVFRNSYSFLELGIDKFSNYLFLVLA